MRIVPLVCCFVAAGLLLGPLSIAGLQAQGLEKGKKYLILHGDDAGMCHSANLGTFAAMEKGIVSSASIMAPCPWFKEAAEYARTHPDRDFGVHLTLTCEWSLYRWGPVAPRDTVPSLLDEEGYLWRTVEQVGEHAKLEEVERELRAQIEQVRQFGVPFTHLDTHMGAVFARADIAQLFVRLGLEYKVPILLIRDTEQLNRDSPELAKYVPAVVLLLETQKLPVLDRLIRFHGSDGLEQRTADYRTCLKDLKPGVTQLIVHCGYANEELSAITATAQARDGDRLIFSDPKMIEEIHQLGIEVISWKQFRTMLQ